MADWEFTTANALTSQTWAKDWWIEGSTDSYFYSHGYIGSSEINDIIVEFKDLEQNPGYQHTFGQIRELSGAGIIDDATAEGNEEVPLTYDDAITFNQYRNAIRTKGLVSEQFKSDQDTRKWAKELLKRWIGAHIDQTIFTGMNDSCTKVLYGGDATSTGTIEAGDYFTLALIGKAVAYAKKATPVINGPSIGGKSLNGVVVISPDQSFDLTTRDSAWIQAQMDAQLRGKDNPIFKDALGMYKNVPIQEHKRVPIATGTWNSLNGASALFMGVASGGIAYVKRKIWNEKTFDYKNKVGFCIGASYGFTKAVFNSADNAVLALRTYRSNN